MKTQKVQSKLEEILDKIEIEKFPEPILTPESTNRKYASIRNSGGIIYKNEIILLPTVRHAKDKKSRIHVARSKDLRNFSLEEKPFIDLNSNFALGVEDPRISKINDIYYIAFTEFLGTEKKNGKKRNITRIGLVKTKDFKKIEERRIILEEYGNNKNGVIIPNEKGFYVIHRPFMYKGKELKNPAARIAYTENFKEFKDLGIFLEPRKNNWDSARVGINSPLVQIGNIALMLYHGADSNNIYYLGLIIIDQKNPRKILARSKKPLIKPEFDWETSGKNLDAEVPNVVFSCNLIPIGNNELITYHSGADKYLGMTKIRIPKEIINKIA